MCVCVCVRVCMCVCVCALQHLACTQHEWSVITQRLMRVFPSHRSGEEAAGKREQAVLLTAQLLRQALDTQHLQPQLSSSDRPWTDSTSSLSSFLEPVPSEPIVWNRQPNSLTVLLSVLCGVAHAQTFLVSDCSKHGN